MAIPMWGTLASGAGAALMGGVVGWWGNRLLQLRSEDHERRLKIFELQVDELKRLGEAVTKLTVELDYLDALIATSQERSFPIPPDVRDTVLERTRKAFQAANQGYVSLPAAVRVEAVRLLKLASALDGSFRSYFMDGVPIDSIDGAREAFVAANARLFEVMRATVEDFQTRSPS